MLGLVIRYAAFAIAATIINLVTQRVVLGVIGQQSGPAFAIAVLGGTATGLAAKYVLDKRWIFFDASTSLRTHGRKFGLYTLMGVITTFIFWSTETFFWITWRTTSARELGALLGLTTGYLIKYNLDRRFVFAPGKAEA
jgi:putative flippase GtrA